MSWAIKNYPRVLMRRPIRAPMGDAEVSLRGWTADLMTYDEIALQHEYRLEVGEPEFIIDAGAHIGLASLYFAQRYPQAQIVAIECDENNFALLKRNARPYPNITCLKAGLWSHETTLQISNPKADTWSFRVQEGEGIPAVTVDGLLERFGRTRVDLLKIDIEGSEKAVLDNSSPWINSVTVLVIELHDRHVAGCSAALEKAIGGVPFRRSISGESVVLIRDDVKASAKSV